MNSWVVYGLFDSAEPNEFRYIGATGRFKERIVAHNKVRNRTTEARNAWVASVRRGGRIVGASILAVAENRNEAGAIEANCVAVFLGLGHRLTNATSGGVIGFTFNAETRAKMAASQLGNTIRRGSKHSQESIAKMSVAHSGRTHSETTKAKMSVAHLGKKYRPMSAVGRANISAAKRAAKKRG